MNNIGILINTYFLRNSKHLAIPKNQSQYRNNKRLVLTKLNPILYPNTLKPLQSVAQLYGLIMYNGVLTSEVIAHIDVFFANLAKDGKPAFNVINHCRNR